MFERYTEHARRAIFLARCEASEVGSTYIEPEHLLLGILRERTSLAVPLPASLDLEQARRDFQAQRPVREKLGTFVDILLTHESKRVLAYAAEEAGRLSHARIGTQHLVLGLLRQPGPASEMLHKYGLDLESLRNDFGEGGAGPVHVATDREVLSKLRERFALISQRLTPEIEPAAIYSLPLSEAGQESTE